MKTLVESLFDPDLATKDITFGDMFECTGHGHTPARTKPIIDAFFIDALKRDTGTKGNDKLEVIAESIRKIIDDTPIVGSESSERLREKLTDRICPYIKTAFSRYDAIKIYEYRGWGASEFKTLLDFNPRSIMHIYIIGKVGLFYNKK